MDAHLPHRVSEVFDNTWQLKARGARSSGGNQRGYRWLGVRPAYMYLSRVDFLEVCGFLKHFKINDWGVDSVCAFGYS